MSHLFSITCTTCNKRIAVRNESAIGQIFNCPNCESMVQIVAPPEYQAQKAQPQQDAQPQQKAQPEPQVPSPPAADSAPKLTGRAKANPLTTNPLTTNPETVEDLAAQFESADEFGVNPESTRAEQSSPSDASFTDASFTDAATNGESAAQTRSFSNGDPVTDLLGDVADSLEDSPVDTTAVNPHALSPDETATSLESEKVMSGPVLPTDQWTSSGTKMLQRCALWVVGAVAGVGLLVVASFGVRSWLQGPDVAVEIPTELPANPTPVDNAEANSTPLNEVTPVIPAADPIPTADPIPAADSIPEINPIPEIDPAAPPPIVPQNPAPVNPVPEIRPDEQNLPATDPPATNPPAEEPPSPLPNVITVAPGEIDIDPSSTNPDQSSNEVSPSQSPDESPPGFVTEPRVNGEPGAETSQSALDELLDRFAPYLDDNPANTDVTVEPDVADDPDEGGVQMSAEVRPRPEPRDIDLPARLADNIPAIEMRDMPLSDMLQFISDFSTIPITLDTESLPWIGKTPESGVTIQATDLTVEEILAKGLISHRLAVLTLDDQLVVTRSSKFHGAMRSVVHKVSDVASTPQELDQLKDWISSLIAPQSWQGQGGDATIAIDEQSLVVSQTEAQQFKILFLLESLRQARGLPQSTKFPAEMFDRSSRYSRAQAMLEKTVSINYGQATPLLKIISKLEEATGNRILVNWRSTMTIGWTPDSLGSVSVQEATLDAALTELLQPMDLGYRIVDERTVEILSIKDLKEQLDFEVYDVSEFVTASDNSKSIIDRFGKMVGQHQLQVNGGSGAFAYDAKSKSLLAALPQPEQILLQKTMNNRASAE